MDHPRSLTGRWWLWDVYHALVATAMAVALLADDLDAGPGRRLVAAGALAAMVVLHVTVGRLLIDRGAKNAAALLVLLVHIALFAVAVAAVPITTWLLFAICPLIFRMVALRAAVVLVVAANLIPVVNAAVRDSDQLAGTALVALICAAAGSWFGAFLVGVLRQSRERATLIAELESSRAEVARLSHETGVAAERTRLSGEIHDTLAQGFTSIITLLQAADPELRDERLALAVRTARENLAEARALVSALSPSALSSGSLLDAVRRQAVRFTEETGTPASFRRSGDERELPTAVAVVLLRAAQEALTNVRRHARAREVAVLLAYAPDRVRLVVRDDGCGFSPGADDGFGLTGMRARAGQVNGALTVRSDPDHGTTLDLEVPA